MAVEFIKAKGPLKRLTLARKIAVLERVRFLISRPDGWAHRDWVKPRGRGNYRALCLGAACQKAALDLGLANVDVFQEPTLSRDDPLGFRSDLKSDKVAAMVSLEELVRSKGFDTVPQYNDKINRTQGKIVELVDERLEQLYEERGAA